MEHIIPESLGNVDHVLPVGWVCDHCNNYLSREVEKPFLDSEYGRSSRSWMRVPSKKGRVPSAIGFHPESRTRIALSEFAGHGLCVGAAPGEDASRWVESFLQRENGSFWFVVPDFPEYDVMTARFIGKIALEVLVKAGIGHSSWNDEIVEKQELDQLRCYVRKGHNRNMWPIHMRRIYPQNFEFLERDSETYQVLHEFQILPTDSGEYYCVIVIFGVQYAINMAAPVIEGFKTWLKENNDRSPLYPQSGNQILSLPWEDGET